MAAESISLLGEWRQIDPDPHPASISITFETGGHLRYAIETTTVQQILLTWRVDGDTIVTDQPSAPREERTRFHFAGPRRLVLQRAGETYRYERA